MSDEQVPARPKRVGVFVAAAAAVLILDLVAKIVVVAELPREHAPIRILWGLVYLQQTRNSGAAFSLGTGFTIVLTVIAIAVVVVLVRIAGRLRSTAWALAFGFILGGAVGNLVDRIFRGPAVGRGHVVDWISAFGPNGDKYPIFNLADSGIVIGAVVAGILALRGIEFDGTRERRTADKAGD